MPSKIKPSAVRLPPELKADLAKLAEIDKTSEHSVHVRGLQDYAIRRLGPDPALAYAPVERPPRAPKAAKPEPKTGAKIISGLQEAVAAAPKRDRRAGFSEAVAPAFVPHPKPGSAKKTRAK